MKYIENVIKHVANMKHIINMKYITKKILNLKPSISIALGLTILAILWMLSGLLKSADSPTEMTPAKENQAGVDVPLAQVRVINSVAKNHQAVTIINGRTEADRLVEIKAETDGRFVSVNMQAGQHVDKGQVLAKIAIDERNAALAQAKALLTQRKLQYEAASKLADKGFQSKTTKSVTEANLSAAKAALKIAQINLNKTVIVAPFDGVIKTKYIDVGGYAKRGDPLAEIVSLDPLYVTGHVAEREVVHVFVGTIVEIRLITGQELTGEITRISPVSDDATRTFKIEAKLDNSLGLIQAGLTAEIRLPLETTPAHLITPALLSLNDEGAIGVKTIDNNDQVVFNNVDIIEDTLDGLWVAGLPKEARVISVGQEYVIDGQQVETAPDLRLQPNAIIGSES